jgi:hypothetical protein
LEGSEDEQDNDDIIWFNNSINIIIIYHLYITINLL